MNLDQTVDLLLRNKEWVFSDIGVFVLSLFVAAMLYLIRRRRRKSPADELAEIELQQRKRASRPFFRWHTSRTDHVELTYDFQNEGGPISPLAIQSDASVVATITPSDLIQSNQTGFVRFRSMNGRLPFPIPFTIRYRTALNESAAVSFVLHNAYSPPETLDSGSMKKDLLPVCEGANRIDQLRNRIENLRLELPPRSSDKTKRTYLAGAIDTMAELGEISEDERGTLHAEYAF